MFVTKKHTLTVMLPSDERDLHDYEAADYIRQHGFEKLFHPNPATAENQHFYAFNPEKAKTVEEAIALFPACESCEDSSGFYYCGIPGVLARCIPQPDGSLRLHPDAHPERCDNCMRLSNDDEAVLAVAHLRDSEPTKEITTPRTTVSVQQLK